VTRRNRLTLPTDIFGLVNAFASGETDATQVVDDTLRRIEQSRTTVNAVVTVDGQVALRAASAVNRRRSRHMPLAGVPITVKDTIETANLRTTAGARRLAQHIPTQDAPVIERLRRAGAIILGKTNTPSLAGDYETWNEVFGATANPWALDRTAGGSSGGSAAAVAAGLTFADIGSDTVGSLTLPAHFCGVYAHRPTLGIVPTLGHIPPLPENAATRDDLAVGPVARSARDLRLLLQVMAGKAGMAHLSAAWLSRPSQEVLRSVRIVAWIDDSAYPLSREVRHTITTWLDDLVNAGVQVDTWKGLTGLSLSELVRLAATSIAAASSVLMTDEYYATTRAFALQYDASDESYEALFARGAALSHRQWLQLREVVARRAALLNQTLDGDTILVTPICAVEAYRHQYQQPRFARRLQVDENSRPYFDQLAWPALASVTGLPATVAPIGRTRANLPVGVQLVTRRFNDFLSIAFAQAVSDCVAPPRTGNHASESVATIDRGPC
jgi:amidase